MGRGRSLKSKVWSLKSAGRNAVRPGARHFFGRPPKATSKPPTSQLVGTRKPPSCDPQATHMRPTCDPRAPLKPPWGEGGR